MADDAARPRAGHDPDALRPPARAGGAGRRFSGYAATFDSDSEPLPFIERIAPGAFTRSLASGFNAKLYVDHDTGRLLATTRAGTLRLTEDARGLRVDADLPDTSDGRDLAEAACDFRDATSQEDAAEAQEDFTNQLEDILDRYGAATAEDRRDVENNLADLAEHSIQDNPALVQQDLQVLARSAENIAQDAGEVQAAVWNGIADGIQECLQD